MPLQCPQCLSTIDVEGTPPHELICPSCGSTFPIDPDATIPWLPDEAPKRLGKFEFLEQLGVGSFGVVYKARDTELGRLVAVKIPRSGSIPNADDLERFLREAKSAAQLKHPGIVSLYDAGTIDGICFLVSEFIQGATLAQRLSGKRFGFRQTAELIAELADALHYAHQHGVVHRDLKSSNVMIDLEGRPHLMDFGLAKRAADQSTSTLDGQVLGTPAYMSPEQARGEANRVDARSDLYSLGVILYQLLTGELPFRGETRMMVVQVIQDEPRPPRRLNDRIPRDLETICLKAMAKEVAGRYQTARDLADDLRRFLTGEPIQARPVGLAERLGRWVTRKPAQAALIAVSGLAALALVGVGVGGVYHFRLRDAHERTRGALHGELAARTRAELAQRDEEQQRRRAELYQYFHHIAVAHAEWRDGSVGRVDSLLKECAPGPRNWEWHYLKRLCHPELLTFRGHAGWVYNVHYSPDGVRLASTGADHSIRIWNASTGQAIMDLKGQVDTTAGFAFSPDGTRIATNEKDQTVRFWHAARGEPIGALPGAKGAVLTYSPDGQKLALRNSDPKQLEIWDLNSGRRVFSLKTNDAHLPAFSPDGSRFLLIPTGGLTVEVWDLASDRKPLLTLKGHIAEARNAAYSPDGSRIATCSYDQTVRLWDSATGRELHTFRGYANEVTCVAFSPDGKRLASASMDQTVKVLDVATGQELLTFKGHSGGVHGVCFSPDGTRLASASLDQTVKVWDATLAPDALTFAGDSSDFRYVSLAFDATDDRLLWAASDGTMRSWDTALAQEVSRSHQSTNLEAVFSKDGKRMAVACADGSVKVTDAPGRSVAATTPRSSFRLPKGASRPLALSADATRLATMSEDGVIAISDTARGQAIPSAKLPAIEIRLATLPRRQVGFSHDLTKVVMAEKGGHYQVWDVITGQTIASLGFGPVEDLPGLFAFSPDGTRIAGRTTATGITIWNAATGKHVAVLEGHYHLVMCLAYSPDGTRLASAGWDRTVKVWDTDTGQEAISFRGHPRAVTGLAFSADGTRLASASFDGTVEVRDARPWTLQSGAVREALGLLHFFFARPLCRDDVIVYLRHFPWTNPQARDHAVTLAQQFQETTDPQAFHSAAWAVILKRHLNAFQYGFALKQAATACRLRPAETRYRATLGFAQYRQGRFHKERYLDALATLAKCDQSQPATLAFLAMTQHQLGQNDQARSTLARLSELMKNSASNASGEAEALVREATLLIEGKPSEPTK